MSGPVPFRFLMAALAALVLAGCTSGTPDAASPAGSAQPGAMVGTWDLAADGSLTTTSGPQTMMACDGAQLPLAVSRGTRVEVDGDTLVISSSFDSTETTLVRSTDSTVGPQGRPIGYWVESTTPTAPFLSIQADGSYSGNDGCNALTGTWEQTDDEAVLFTAGAMTLMACEGIDQWLNLAAQGRVQAGVMTLQAADGTVLGQLSSR